MQTLTEIKEILASRGMSPRKGFGQNFLTDHNLIRKLVDAANPLPTETVLEIGPGTGTMTEELLARGCRVIACEIDRGLSVWLREHFGSNDRFTLVEGDCLDTKSSLSAEALAAIGPANAPFLLISNLPYAAATPVMSTLLADHPSCRGLFVTIQKEVADRLAALHGSKDFGTLSVLAQAVATVETVAKLPPGCFWPQPDVTSAMIAIRRLATPRHESPRALAGFCQKLFEKRRKQIGAILGREGPWPEGITPELRAEQLSVEQLIVLERTRKGPTSARTA